MQNFSMELNVIFSIANTNAIAKSSVWTHSNKRIFPQKKKENKKLREIQGQLESEMYLVFRIFSRSHVLAHELTDP